MTMTQTKGPGGLRLINALAYLLMVTVNVLANVLPIGGMTTGDISDAYPNLFAPAGFTFSVWGLIYVLLGGFVLYQLGVIGKKNPISPAAMAAVGPYFAVSSLANTVWIFAWHNNYILASLILMVILFLCLAAIFVRVGKLDLSPRGKALGPDPLRRIFRLDHGGVHRQYHGLAGQPRLFRMGDKRAGLDGDRTAGGYADWNGYHLKKPLRCVWTCFGVGLLRDIGQTRITGRI